MPPLASAPVALPRRIIYTHGGGRLGNQLIAAAHLLAFWREQAGSFTLFNTALWHHQDDFEGDVVSAPEGATPSGLRLLRRLYHRIELLPVGRRIKMAIYMAGVAIAHLVATVAPGCSALTVMDLKGVTNRIGRQCASLDLNDCNATTQALGRAPTLLLAGYGLRSWELVEKHQDFIRHYLRPKSAVAARARARIATLRATSKTVIGLQIRQGDYKLWKNGRFWFSSEQYALWMVDLARRFAVSGPVAFLVCSETPIPATCFVAVQVPIVYAWEGDQNAPKSSAVSDMVSLSECDVIVAPPSTFAFWAAFIGKRPVLCLTDRNISISSVPLVENNLFDAARDPVLSAAVS